MDTNINIINSKYLFLHKKSIIDSVYRSKIVNHSFFSINEANICYKIKKMPYYSNFFSLLEDYEELNIAQLYENNADLLEKLNLSDNMRYYLFKYDDRNSIHFIEYLYEFTDIKKLILGNINALQQLLQGLRLLNEHNICFFNVSYKNILFLENYREKPVLANVKFSLQLNKLDYGYISQILNKIDDFTYQPFEIHILYYFVKYNITTISYAFIEEFCEEYVDNLHILRLFSEQYKQKYKEICMETMKKYINRSQNEIIDDILERNDKWDIYGISILFLHIFGCISRVFSLKNTFISEITMELSKNIHPDSDKRMNLEDMINTVNKCLHKQNDWTFVNNLDNNILPQLFIEFEK